MKTKTINKILATVIFIVFLPLLMIELMVVCLSDFISKIILNYQILLFFTNFGSKK